MQLFLVTIVVALFSLGVPLGILQADSAFAGEAKTGGETEWTKTVAAAKKEGKLAVFLYHDRTKEHLGESDQGIVLYRHLLDHQMQAVAAGKDPMNVFREPSKNVRLNLPTESREKFLTGRLGARSRYSQRHKPLNDRRTPLP